VEEERWRLGDRDRTREAVAYHEPDGGRRLRRGEHNRGECLTASAGGWDRPRFCTPFTVFVLVRYVLGSYLGLLRGLGPVRLRHSGPKRAHAGWIS
jgi:hypothetical protein